MFFPLCVSLFFPLSNKPDGTRFEKRCSKLCIVTLHAQTQPVFVDLREKTEGRWELEVPPEQVEQEEEKPPRTDENGDQGQKEEEEEEEEEEDEAYIRRNR